jgi:hypothetical protein
MEVYHRGLPHLPVDWSKVMALWDKNEIDYLVKNSADGSKQIAVALNRSEASVIQKAYVLRISFTGKKLKSSVAYTKRSRDGGLKIWKSELPPFHHVMLGLWPNALDGSYGKKPNRRLWRKRRAIVLKLHDECCYYCGDPANTVDHIKPRHLGGTDHISNLVAACSDCNSGWIQQIPWRDKHFKKRLQGV